MRFAGARPTVTPSGQRLQAGKSHYLRGNDPSHWRRDIPTFGEVRYEDVYPGIDTVFYGADGHVAFDFVVAPGADASQISMVFDGYSSSRIASNGDLVLSFENGEFRQQRLRAYQPHETGVRPIPARFELGGDGEVGFTLEAYDPELPLVIDPVIVFSAYVGSSLGADRPEDMAIDSSGAIFVAGTTESSDFPATGSSLQSQFGGGRDGFVMKLSPDGSTVLYCTYLGGSGSDECLGIDVNASGAAFVVGATTPGAMPPTFPTTPGAFDTTPNAGDAFVAKLSPNGATLEYSTFLGGVVFDAGHDIAIDSSGAAYVCGRTDPAFVPTEFPTTPGAFDTSANGSADGFVAKLNAAGSALEYSSYLGGSDYDEADAIAVDTGGNAFVVGFTNGPSFPATPGAFDVTYNGIGSLSDVFVTKVAASGATLSYSTFLGGTSAEMPGDIAVDGTGRAYVVGRTYSSDFPTTAGVFQVTNNGLYDAFAAGLSASGAALEVASLLGGEGDDFGESVSLDGTGSFYAVGTTTSADFPTTPGAFDRTLSSTAGDAFVTRFSSNAATVGYSTYVGGLGSESGMAAIAYPSGEVLLTGSSGSDDFPIIGGAETGARDGADVFVTKLSASGAAAIFSRALGGTRGFAVNQLDATKAIAVDPAGYVYVAGNSPFAAFPSTIGSYDTTLNGDYDMVVSKVSPDGTVLVYSTFIGGSAGDGATDLVLTPSGAVVVSGGTQSASFPTTPGAFDRTYSGTDNAVVLRLSPDGSSLEFSTFLSGSGDSGSASGVSLDPSDGVFVCGDTTSPTFPTTPGAFSTTHNGNRDGFLVKLLSDGSALTYSTFLGGIGNDSVYAMEADANGAVYCTGTAAPSFPVTSGAFDTSFNGSSHDAFVAKLSSNGSTLVYSTFLGGTGLDSSYDLAVDQSGSAYVVGTTESLVFPTTPGAYQTVRSTSTTGFVTKIGPGGDALVFSSLIDAASLDSCETVAVDRFGSVLVGGHTTSVNFPITPGALATAAMGGTDGFLLQLSQDGSSLLFSSLLGGSANDSPSDILAIGDGTVYLVGQTFSEDFVASGFGLLVGSSGFILRISALAGSDTPGLYDPATSSFFLRNVNGPGSADVTVSYGTGGAGFVPVVGDWNGDGLDSIGLYAPSTGAFFLRNSNTPGPADVVFTFGAGGPGLIPLVGDWDGNGIDTVGLYVSATGAFFLRNSNSPGVADVVFTFGAGGLGLTPLAGDWDGDAVDTAGLYDSTSGAYFLTNSNGPGPADVVFTYGPAGASPVVGDWTGDGVDSIGVSVVSTGAWFQRDTNGPGLADRVFAYGAGGLTPLVGNWDGQ